MKRCLWFLCLLILPAALPAQTPGHRLAFVSGMSAYKNVNPLGKSLDDSEKVANALKGVGFAVTSADDLNRDDFLQAFDGFVKQINVNDTVLIYYAGHGIQANGANYLLPLDFKAAGGDIEKQAVRLDSLIQKIAARSPRFKILVIDSCQDNPLHAKSPGLAEMKASTYGAGTYIATSAAPGQTASDGVFAPRFAAELTTVGIPLSEVFIRVRKQVLEDSHQRQQPSSTDSLTESFYFAVGDPATKLVRLTATLTYQPDGGASSQAVLQLTPNAGDASYSATLVGIGGSGSIGFSNGVSETRGHSTTFTFQQATPGRIPILTANGYMMVSAATMQIAVDQSSLLAGQMATGNITGNVKMLGYPFAATDKYRAMTQSPPTDAAASSMSVNAQLVGNYSATLVPKGSSDAGAAANSSGGPSAPTPVLPPNFSSGAGRTDLARGVGAGDTSSCASGCQAKIGDFKVVAKYQYPHSTYPSLRCDEKVFKLPDAWPSQPFLHSVVCKGPNANNVPVVLINFRLANTDRVKDQDAVIVFNDGNGLGHFQAGRNGRLWRVKIYGTGDLVESMSISETP